MRVDGIRTIHTNRLIASLRTRALTDSRKDGSKRKEQFFLMIIYIYININIYIIYYFFLVIRVNLKIVIIVHDLNYKKIIWTSLLLLLLLNDFQTYH